MDVSKRLAAAAGLTMWGGVFFAVFAAVLTGPVLHVAAIHWVAAGAWTVGGCGPGRADDVPVRAGPAPQPDVMKVQPRRPGRSWSPRSSTSPASRPSPAASTAAAA